MYLLVDKRRSGSPARLLEFRTYVSPDDGQLVPEVATELSGFPDFDEARRELVVWRKFRGVGDCGLRAVYQFNSEQPRLREARAKIDCDGTMIPPERWPLVSERR
jgi:hypothetical protein